MYAKVASAEEKSPSSHIQEEEEEELELRKEEVKPLNAHEEERHVPI